MHAIYVIERVYDSGSIIRFLPPDLNPIEEAFASPSLDIADITE